MLSFSTHPFLFSVVMSVATVGGVTILMVLAMQFQHRFMRKVSKGGHRAYRVCEYCRTEYYLTPLEISFYTSHDRPLPKTCRGCKGQSDQLQERRIANF